MSEVRREHGTMQAYVTGFILSLIFTFVPYYLVVNQKYTGTALLVTILGFGVLQMLVQVIFFLHLGRGPRPNWQFYFLFATIGTILVVVGGSIVITSNLHKNMIPPAAEQTKKLVNDEAIYQINGEKTGACQQQYANHQVTIKNGAVSPLTVQATKCDTLTFMNEDSVTRQLDFGEHLKPVTYAGVTGYAIPKNHNTTITLSESGTYLFHTQPGIYAQLVVTP